MAIFITPDVVAGTNYFEDDKGGDFTRVFRVDGLASNTKITNDALYAVDGTNTLPRAGQQHPTMPDFVVRQVSVVPVRGSTTAVMVAFRYVKVRRRLLDVRMNGVSTNELSRVDRYGKRMRIGYNGPATIGGTTTAAKTAFPDPVQGRNTGYVYSLGEHPKLVPQRVLEIVYLEDGSPDEKIDKYQRKLNSKPWQGGDSREWLCESITAVIESPIPLNLADLPDQTIVKGDARFNWIVTYRFLKKKKPKKVGNGVTDSEGWDPVLLWTDPNLNISATDIDPLAGEWPTNKKGNGWAEFQLYDEADFNELDLVSAVVKATT